MRHISGFTLIELMLALAISAVLIAIGYPAYTHYQTRAERNRAEVALLQLSAKMEEYCSDNGTYEAATIAALHADQLTQGLDYRLKITKATDTHFTIEAIPNNIQSQRDINCGTLILNDQNKRSITGDGDAVQCWM